MKLRLLHPFTARSIGFNEEHLYSSHSVPHCKALIEIQKRQLNWSISVDYFTNTFKNYSLISNGLKKSFWCSTNIKDRGIWRKEKSFFHFLSNVISLPDITIINMSGHGSKYVFNLAKFLKRKNRMYIPMIGGMHMSINGQAYDYYKNAKFIIVHTEIQKVELMKLDGFSKFDIRVLPLGVDVSKFKPIANKIVTNKMLFVGRISRLKQIEKAIEALHFCRTKGLLYSLDIVGPKSDENYFNKLEMLIEKLNLKPYVSFKGKQNQSDIVNFYNNSEVLLLPSKHESFGMVIAESMACKIPVVVIKGSGGPEEIIINRYDGIISNNNDYTKDVYNLLVDKEFYKRISDNCLISVEKKWTQKRTTDLLESFLKELALN